MAFLRALGWMAATAVFAVDFTALPRQGALSDYTRRVDAASRRRCDAMLDAHRAAGKARIAIVILPGTGREGVPAVAESMRRAWNEDGLLLVASGEQRAAVAARPGIEIDEEEVIHRFSSVMFAKNAANEGPAAIAAAQTLVAATGGGSQSPSPRRNPMRHTGWVVLAATAAVLATRRVRSRNVWRDGSLFRSGRGGFGGANSGPKTRPSSPGRSSRPRATAWRRSSWIRASAFITATSRTAASGCGTR